MTIDSLKFFIYFFFFHKKMKSAVTTTNENIFFLNGKYILNRIYYYIDWHSKRVKISGLNQKY